MLPRDLRCSRRKFLASAAALTVTTQAASVSAQEPSKAAPADAFRSRPAKPSTTGRKPIAVVTTVYRPMSHAYHIAGRFVQGYTLAGKRHVPDHFVRSLVVEQKPDNDLSVELAKQHEIKLTKSISEALTLGTGKLAVEGVLLIGEHGNYERNERGQVLYPRYELFEQIIHVFKQTGQVVPVFNDKHLSYSWTKAKKMVDWAKELRVPFMAGSSLPVTWRRPELELPLDAPISEGLVAAYGPSEIYGFHALETLQVMLERRKGGETGVKAVTCLSGKEVWQAADAGLWSWELLEAALGRSESVNIGDVRDNVGTVTVSGMPAAPPLAFIVEYVDGTKGTALLLNGHVQDFTFACKLKNQKTPSSCLFHLPPPPGAKYFDCLVHNIEKLFTKKVSPYPVERTLLTSGTLDRVMESLHAKGKRCETPELASLRYTAPADSGFFRGEPSAPVANS